MSWVGNPGDRPRAVTVSHVPTADRTILPALYLVRLRRVHATSGSTASPGDDQSYAR